MSDILQKRTRRNEVSILILTEEITELKYVLHSVYNAILHLSRKVPQETGATAAEMLMMPPWYHSPKTGDVMPYPANLDLSQRGLGSFNLKISMLQQIERDEIRKRQYRIYEHLQELEKREKERAKILEGKSL